MNDAFKQFFALMKRKVFGVPVSLIFLLIAAIVVFVAWRYRPKSETAETVPEEEVSGDALTVATGTGNQVLAPSGIASVYREETNDTWLRRGAETLASAGYRQDFTVSALTKWLRGDGLSATEDDIVKRVISTIGLPPELPGEAGQVIQPITPSPVSGAPEGVEGYFRNPSNGEIWEYRDGVRKWITAADWARVPAELRTATNLDPTNPIWKTPIIGADPSPEDSMQTVSNGYYRDSKNGAIWEVKNGRRRWIRFQEWASIRSRSGGSDYDALTAEITTNTHPIAGLPVDGSKPTGGYF